jgi:dipeptidase
LLSAYPDDKVVILPNVVVQREVNLKDTMNVLAAPDILEYAIKKGWYDPKSGKPFDFKKAYDVKLSGDFAVKNGCDARQWRGQCLVTGKSIDLPLKEDGLPFAVTPNHKLTVLDIRRILSDHMEGTDYDLSNTKQTSNFQLPASNVSVCNPPKDISKPILYNNYNYAKGTPHKLMSADNGMICADNHQEIGVFQLRSWLPAEIGCIYWRTTASPCSSVLTPWYVGINDTPEPYHKDYMITDNVKYDFHFNPPQGTYDFDETKAFWIFNSVENLVDQNYGKYIGLVRSVYDNFEQKEIASQDDIEKTALDLYKKDKTKAKDFLTMYSVGLALQAIDEAKKLEKKLKTELLGF